MKENNDSNDIFYWESFYNNNVKRQIEQKGEAYIEWLTCKSSLVRQMNWLRNKYDLKIEWFEKPCNPSWTCIFIKPNRTPNPEVSDTTGDAQRTES